MGQHERWISTTLPSSKIQAKASRRLRKWKLCQKTLTRALNPSLLYSKILNSSSSLALMSQSQKHSVFGWSNGPLVTRFQSPRFLGGESMRTTVFLSIWSLSKGRHCWIAGMSSLIWIKTLSAINSLRSPNLYAELNQILLTSISVCPRPNGNDRSVHLTESSRFNKPPESSRLCFSIVPGSRPFLHC